MSTSCYLVAVMLAFAGLGRAQQPTISSAVGTVAALRAEAGELDVKSDAGGSLITVKVEEQTLLRRVAPGEKDLRKSAPVALSEIAPGDRVLVSFPSGGSIARRIIVMPATAIAQRNEIDREDWERRGVLGVVASKKENEIRLRVRSVMGEGEAVVAVGDNTTYRRYAPDSVKFSDAKPSSLAEVSDGDQLRARGAKSEDGRTVTAGEIVFGTFLTVAGSVASIDAAAGEIAIKETATGKSLVIAMTTGSQLKRMPDFGAMLQAEPVGAGGEAPGSPATPARGVRDAPERPRAGATPGARPDISKFLDRLPATELNELKPGETIVVLSTKGAIENHLTAITVVANAEMLVRMATMRSGTRNRADSLGTGPGIGMMDAGGLGGLDLPGMIP